MIYLSDVDNVIRFTAFRHTHDHIHTQMNEDLFAITVMIKTLQCHVNVNFTWTKASSHFHVHLTIWLHLQTPPVIVIRLQMSVYKYIQPSHTITFTLHSQLLDTKIKDNSLILHYRWYWYSNLNLTLNAIDSDKDTCVTKRRFNNTEASTNNCHNSVDIPTDTKDEIGSSSTSNESDTPFTMIKKVKSEAKEDPRVNQQKIVRKYENIHDNPKRLVKFVRKNVLKRINNKSTTHTQRRRRSRRRLTRPKKRKTIKELKNFVPTARAMTELLRDPKDPFSESATKANDFLEENPILNCDGVDGGNALWCEAIFQLEKTCCFLCKECASSHNANDITKYDGSAVRMLTLQTTSPESTEETMRSRTIGRVFCQIEEGENESVETIDLTDESWRCQMYRQTMKDVSSIILSKRRRVKVTGMLCGLSFVWGTKIPSGINFTWWIFS